MGLWNRPQFVSGCGNKILKMKRSDSNQATKFGTWKDQIQAKTFTDVIQINGPCDNFVQKKNKKKNNSTNNTKHWYQLTHNCQLWIHWKKALGTRGQSYKTIYTLGQIYKLVLKLIEFRSQKSNRIMHRTESNINQLLIDFLTQFMTTDWSCCNKFYLASHFKRLYCSITSELAYERAI